MTDALEVRGLRKTFGKVVAVDEVSFSAAAGSTIGLLGGNGAGKTTTISMLLGLLTPTAGSVRVLGRELAPDRYAVLARMNFSSPYVALPHPLPAGQNIRDSDRK